MGWEVGEKTAWPKPGARNTSRPRSAPWMAGTQMLEPSPLLPGSLTVGSQTGTRGRRNPSPPTWVAGIVSCCSSILRCLPGHLGWSTRSHSQIYSPCCAALGLHTASSRPFPEKESNAHLWLAFLKPSLMRFRPGHGECVPSPLHPKWPEWVDTGTAARM